jgi:hypothetical protein
MEPVGFIPLGLADGANQSASFPGSCRVLQNLVFDRIEHQQLIARPGVIKAVDFTVSSGGVSFSSPGIISCAYRIGYFLYGLIATARNSGYDEPFCYNFATNAFVAVSGVTSGNVPLTPTPTGSWTPPTMDVVSTTLLVTHPGFSGSNYFGWFDLTNTASPVWHAGNLSVSPLLGYPVAVSNFNDRAYFAVGNTAFFSDSLLPLQMTSYTQSLQMGASSSNIVAMAGLPITTGTQGIMGALIVFKQESIWQVNGDVALGNLFLDELTDATGCIAPRTIALAPTGMYFMAKDGIRQILQGGTVSPPNPDLYQPFTLASNPSRACASWNNSVYRVAFDTTFYGQALPAADFWLDTLYNRWNGPHTFPYHLALPVANDDHFLLASNSYPAALYVSDVLYEASSYTENGSLLQCVMKGQNMPIVGDMREKYIIQSTIEIQNAAPKNTYNISAIDDQGNVIAQGTVENTGGGSIWGSFTWGSALWGSSQSYPKVFRIPWPNPIVYKRMAYVITVSSSSSVGIKNIFSEVESLGYVLL